MSRHGLDDHACVVYDAGGRLSGLGTPKLAAAVSTYSRMCRCLGGSARDRIQPASMLGTLVAHYRVTGRLGAGGMGVVYEAEDTTLSRLVALKFLSEEMAHDPDSVRRFTREAEIIALLEHPSICAVYDSGMHDGQRFIVMERVQGVNLKTYMTRRRLETAELARISRQVADALDAAHRKGVVHRDIKPGNVMVTTAGDVKVLDFGLARRFQPEERDPWGGSTGSTMPGKPVGTANYMAPERILQLPVDPRSDLFSLGVMMYEMATGRLPFGAASTFQTVTNVLTRNPAPLRALSPDRPVELERVVARLMAREPGDRFQSAAELRDALAALEAPGAASRLRRFARRLFTRGSTV